MWRRDPETRLRPSALRPLGTLRGLEPPYAALVEALSRHRPRAAYSLVLHGSTLWGDRTLLRDGTPVSDVDVLVVGHSLGDLEVAARELVAIEALFRVPRSPWFKVGAKFRTVDELAPDWMSANEFAALLHGRLLAGSPVRVVDIPAASWLREQASLAVATRRHYNAAQARLLQQVPMRTVLLEYLAAKTLLDVATAVLLNHGIVGRSYSFRVRAFSRLAAEQPQGTASSADRDLLAKLNGALRCKRDPQLGAGCELEAAELALVEHSERLGIAPYALAPQGFWETHRPLDQRDRALLSNDLARIS